MDYGRDVMLIKIALEQQNWFVVLSMKFMITVVGKDSFDQKRLVLCGWDQAEYSTIIG